MWSELEPGTFISKSSNASWGWLRYRHIHPSDREWIEMLDSHTRPETIEREQGALISDYYAYNDKATGPLNGEVERRQVALGNHWVGDLAVECDLDIQSERGEFALDLVESGVHYRCTFDIASGRATLTIDGESPAFISDDGIAATSPPIADTGVRGPGKHAIRFANADDQLQLWVDGDVVSFDGPTTYEPPEVNAPRWSLEDPGDLAPVGVGVYQGVVKINRLKVLRDVYYVAAAGFTTDDEYAGGAANVQEVFRDPETWERTTLFAERKMAEFVIGPDKFMPLGDNSPQSSDGRLWGYKDSDPDELRDVPEEPVFDEKQLIGKAMLIYWPHGWWKPVPFTPNFRRMKLIH
jgi:signal peptidase I